MAGVRGGRLDPLRQKEALREGFPEEPSFLARSLGRTIPAPAGAKAQSRYALLAFGRYRSLRLSSLTLVLHRVTRDSGRHKGYYPLEKPLRLLTI